VRGVAAANVVYTVVANDLTASGNGGGAGTAQQAQANIAPLGDTPEAQSIDREVQGWMIQQLLPLAQERAGQDKLYFKFFLNNRCKQQFGLP